ncbi:Elongation factor P, putative [Ricinus communis]|uniref:Elongation factor P, putative n=1 Tax=Ricinus communis TaxID=3988 RepID=B9T941_RICCO|nr:Elongation factor P, putative [Ricinus communis]
MTALHQIRKKLSESLTSSSSILKLLSSSSSLYTSPWSASQYRGAKVTAIHLRPGNVIETKGKVYQVLEVEHKQRGRGGASMQVELRNIDNGNKQSLRFNTEEAVERVFVQERSFTFLYEEQGKAYLMDPEKFEQLEVPTELFGNAAPYLKEDMQVKLQLYDEAPLSGSIPKQVTCTIKETQPPMKGLTATPRYKKALLDNNVTIQLEKSLSPVFVV